MMAIDQDNPIWHDRNIVDMGPTEFRFSLATKTVQRNNPPKLGPDDNQELWFEIEVTLLLGGAKVGAPVRFPAHEPLSPQVAFLAVMKASLALADG